MIVDRVTTHRTFEANIANFKVIFEEFVNKDLRENAMYSAIVELDVTTEQSFKTNFVAFIVITNY